MPLVCIKSSCYIHMSHSFFYFFKINKVRTPLRSKLLFGIMSNNFPNYFCVVVFNLLDYRYLIQERRSQWPGGLRRRSATAHLLRLRVRIPRGALITVCCDCCVLSGRGLWDELIARPEKSCRLWCVVLCDLESS